MTLGTFLLLVLGVVLVLIMQPLGTAATTNQLKGRFPDQRSRRFPVLAGEQIYRDTFVGLNPAGYLKNFVPGDRFVGVANEKVDATLDTSSGDQTAEVDIVGDFELTLSGAAVDDIGKPVYCTDNNTLSLTGHPDAFVGTIVNYLTTDTVLVRMRPLGQKPPNGEGSIQLLVTGLEQFSATGIDGATHGNIYVGVPGGACEGKSILGAGISPADGADGGISMKFDAVAEIALASLRMVKATLPVSGGITMDVDFVAADSGDDAALDIDVGLGTALTTNSEANIDHADMVQLAAFHMDGNSDNILCQSDDNTTDVAPVDSTIDNDSTTDVPKHLHICVRPSGDVEFWVDNSRVLATTTFKVAADAELAAFVNMEKTANDTSATVIVRNLRVAGAAAAKAA